MDNKYCQKLIKRLHSKRLPDDVAKEIIKLGKDGYDYLWEIIDDSNLTDYQVINIIRILYQMKYYDIDVFVNKLLSFTQDKRIDVRSTACFLAICLFRIKKEFKELNIPLEQEILVKYLRQALEMELHQSIRQQIEDLFQVSI
ncbi:hypothetical protein NIES4071_82760 [Calothrix sp. NIES-4071]|nr:hypothetical protein NIES4071_82760 [Calothrix sp. NIES-4071]BAZ62545.1 hypothetical protein NIES4105_82690 [Calothrix sp. NIES-4105]